MVERNALEQFRCLNLGEGEAKSQLLTMAWTQA